MNRPLDLGALTRPRGNGYTTGGLYFEDLDGDCQAIYCQITGKECAVYDHDIRNFARDHDCRTCNIPIMAALCRLSQTIGSQEVK